MRIVVRSLVVLFALLLAVPAYASLTQGPAYYKSNNQARLAQPPDDCEMGVMAYLKNCTVGMDPRQFFYKNDTACAQKRIGVTAYTAEMSVFNDNKCTGGICDNSKPGIAHRVWPLGSKVEVCDMQTSTCAIAVVMDRGPNVCLARRTIDANPALQRELHMRGGLDQATYRLLSAPGVTQTAEPSGPTQASLDAMIAANRQMNQGNMIPSMNYSTINTPWGVGYLGTAPGGAVLTQDYYCVTSIEPVVVTQLHAGDVFPSNCYNRPPASSAPFASMLPPPPAAMPISAQQYPSPTGKSYDGGGSATSTGAVLPQAAALIIAQPSVVSRGAPILVSWSTVGMTTRPPCQVSQDGNVIAQSNASSTAVQTRLLQSGTLTFTLSCTTLTGQTTTQSTSATVH